MTSHISWISFESMHFISHSFSASCYWIWLNFLWKVINNRTQSFIFRLDQRIRTVNKFWWSIVLNCFTINNFLSWRIFRLKHYLFRCRIVNNFIQCCSLRLSSQFENIIEKTCLSKRNSHPLSFLWLILSHSSLFAFHYSGLLSCFFFFFYESKSSLCSHSIWTFHRINGKIINSNSRTELNYESQS